MNSKTFTPSKEYLKLLNDEDFYNEMMQLVKEAGRVSGFDKHLSFRIAESVDYSSLSQLPTIDNDRYSLRLPGSIRLMGDSEGNLALMELHNPRVLNEADTPEKLLALYDSYGEYLKYIFERISNDAIRMVDFKFNNHKRKIKLSEVLYNDLIKADPELFFSYDDFGELYFYLPSLDAYVSTSYDNVGSKKDENLFYTDKLPRSMRDGRSIYDFNLKVAVTVNIDMYLPSNLNVLLELIEKQRVKMTFANPKEIYRKEESDESYMVIHAPYNGFDNPDRVEIKEELAAAARLDESKYVNYYRLSNGEFLVVDCINKNVRKIKDVLEFLSSNATN